MTISYLPHTADIRMRVTAPSLEKLFYNATMGMNGILKEDFCRGATSVKNGTTLEITGKDHTAMLIDFLSEVLSLSYAEKCLFCDMEIVLGEDRLWARLFGIPIGIFDEEIKAVTYHEARISRNEDDEWEAMVLFDI